MEEEEYYDGLEYYEDEYDDGEEHEYEDVEDPEYYEGEDEYEDEYEDDYEEEDYVEEEEEEEEGEEYENEYEEDGDDGEEEFEEVDEDTTENLFPSYIPDELIPKSFKSAKEELEFYRQNYVKVANYAASDEYVNHVIENYRDLLLEQEQDAETVKAYYAALKKGDPKAFIKMQFPEALAAEGVDPTLSKYEAYSIVDSKMKEEFGDDWKERFNIDDSYDAKSESGKMAMRQREIAAEVQEHNQAAEQEMAKYRPPDPQRVQELVEEQFEEHFRPSGFTREAYDEFIEEIKDWKYTLADIHRAKYFDGYMEQAKQEAFELGKKAAMKSIASVQGTKSSPEERRKPRTLPKKTSLINSPFDLYS